MTTACKAIPSPHELALCGLFGAAALVLPFIFHALRVGHVFMPMYLPIVALGFLVRPAAAMGTALVVPVLSGAATGMPPFFPPVAFFMAVELSVMAGLISAARTRLPGLDRRLLLLLVLVLGRCLYVMQVYLCSRFLQLPAGFLAGLSFFSGWPGILLMLAAVPPFVRGMPPPDQAQGRSHAPQ